MDNKKLSTLLGICIIPGIVRELKISDDEMIESLDKLYRSALYDVLIQEETAVWHLSPTTLANIYLEELKTGILELPEDQ
ncbi:MAG: hypothetical protein LBU70_06560 [Chitinispirillales bacterium]|jgi:hypothetical protein|nr:hypothetical protein [Chitinispirillales bacterium]